MSDDGSEWTNDIHCGDAAETLREMPESSVHMAMTSPPYYGLRDYSEDGQIGLEDSLDEYIDNLVSVGDELRRVLRDDGSWWLNIGDSFSQRGRNSNEKTSDELDGQSHHRGYVPGGFGPKNKMLVPHRVAIALQDTGWIVRADCPWVKPNPMPGPEKDRFTEHKEFVFHLTPEPDYWFDLDSVREPYAESTLNDASGGYTFGESKSDPSKVSHHSEGGVNDPHQIRGDLLHPNGKNPGDIFEVPTKPFPDAHFAVYPEELCEKPIKSSCPPTVCAECGTPYERETVTEHTQPRHLIGSDRPQARRAVEKFDESDLTGQHLAALRAVGLCDAGQAQETQDGHGNNTKAVERMAEAAKDVLGGYAREFLGEQVESTEWASACECDTTETEPGIVLDPFAGAGTTCLVAKRLGRRFVGVDLSPEYVAMAQKRVGIDVDEPQRLLDTGETALTQFSADGGNQ